MRSISLPDPPASALPSPAAGPTPTPPAGAALVRLEGVSKFFPVPGGGQIAALRDVSLEVPRGAVYGVIGPSGSGKSTLLRCLNGLERPSAGRVLVGGQDVTARGGRALRAWRRRVGMIFQHFNLLSSRTVFENVALPLKLAGMPRAERARLVEPLLGLVGLADKGGAYPARLSGGQKQRVGIARALVHRPELLLCDEATSALDPPTTHAILALLRDLHRRLGLTVVLITHELAVVREICDRVAVLEAGRLAEAGEVYEVLATPRAEATRRLLGLGDGGSTLPAALAGELRPAPATADDHALLRVRLHGRGVGLAVFADLARERGVAAVVIQGGISYVGHRPLGDLVVAVPAADGLAATLDYLRPRVGSAELLGYVPRLA